MPKPEPKAPKDSAPASEHKRHAKEVLEHDYYRVPPGHLPKNDDVSEFTKGEKHEPD